MAEAQAKEPAGMPAVRKANGKGYGNGKDAKGLWPRHGLPGELH